MPTKMVSTESMIPANHQHEDDASMMATQHSFFNRHSNMSVQVQFVESTAEQEQSSVGVCVCGGTSPSFSGPDRLWLIKPPSDARGQDNSYTLCLQAYNVDIQCDCV